MREHGGKIPVGVLRTSCRPHPTPGSPPHALRHHVFGEVAAGAIEFARDGFPMYFPCLAGELRQARRATCQLPVQSGDLPARRQGTAGQGDVSARPTSVATIRFMADEEQAAARRGRAAGLEAARDCLLPRRHRRAHRGSTGTRASYLSAEDLAEYRSPVRARRAPPLGDLEIFTCGAWCQGPTLLQSGAWLKAPSSKALAHNSADYLHQLMEALKLAFSDRESTYSDPATGRSRSKP